MSPLNLVWDSNVQYTPITPKWPLSVHIGSRRILIQDKDDEGCQVWEIEINEKNEKNERYEGYERYKRYEWNEGYEWRKWNERHKKHKRHEWHDWHEWYEWHEWNEKNAGLKLTWRQPRYPELEAPSGFVSGDNWIRNEKGERVLWVPYDIALPNSDWQERARWLRQLLVLGGREGKTLVVDFNSG